MFDKKPNKSELKHDFFKAGRKAYETEGADINRKAPTLYLRGWLFAAADYEAISFETAAHIYLPMSFHDQLAKFSRSML